MGLDLSVTDADMARARYGAGEFERDWDGGVPADAIARAAGRPLEWVYRERKRLGLDARNPVGYEDR